MSAIVLCNTGADSLSYIDLQTLKVTRILFDSADGPVGPHGIKVYDDKIITANNYNDSISIFSATTFKEELNVKIGPKPNDLVKVGEHIFTICGESNTVVAYDLNQQKIIWELTIGSWPHSIDYCKSKKLLFITNLEDNSTKIIDLKGESVLKTLKTPEYPTKVKLSNNEKYIYICESYLGSDDNGYIDIFSVETFERVARVQVGTSPIDLFEDERSIYVSNFTEGSISIIDKIKFTCTKTLKVGGMPKGIIKDGENIYIGDYLKGRLMVIEKEQTKKIIAIESEPNAMILI